MDTTDRTKAPPAAPAEGDPSGAAPPAKTKKKLVGPRAFKLLWDAHSVTGIVIGLGLFVIFFAGAFALYRGELHAWADPALRTTEVRLSADAVTTPLLAEHPPAQGTDLQVTYPIRERTYYFVRYETIEADSTRPVQAYVNASTGASFTPAVPNHVGRSMLSEMLYDLHFFGQAGMWGEILSGLAAVFFLFAVVSGLLIHWRKLPKDWHTFRPRARLRTALADAHNVLGLIGLPFTVMYAITGAFLALLVILLAPTVLVVFDGDTEALEATLSGFEMPPHEPTGAAAQMLSFEDIEEAVPASWDGVVEMTSIIVHGWGDEAAVAVVYGDVEHSLTQSPRAALSATTGEVLAANDPPTATALGGTTAVMTNLHYARLGSPLAKVLFFLLALATSAVILTGNVLWVLVRRPKDPRATPWLHRVLARLTVGVGCGLVAAVPLLFLTTAALPMDLPSLRIWEHVALFGGWAVLIAAAFFGPSPVWAARWQLALAGALSLIVPLANGLGTGAWPWVTAPLGQWAVFWVDVGFLLSAPILLWIAWRLSGEAHTLDRNAPPV
ncbi:MAG: hypothetical protein GVY18_15860 [Bacteroidetes bacterium]|jgi:uncharacterized iron-regulated membrane protein|nr:hypothetical protein [Bacteroidota bacterium]